MKSQGGVDAGVYFLRRDKRYEVERPYAFKFDPTDGFPGTNVTRDFVRIHVEDIRGREQDFELEKQGFCVHRIDDTQSYEDYFVTERLEAYFRKMESILKHKLGANKVQVFRHCIRKRDPAWPFPTGETLQFDQPTTSVHVDTNPNGTRDEIKLYFKDEADDRLEKRYQWINFWKPIAGPVNDWPLLLCDASTINPATDLAVADLLYPDHITENSMMYYREGLKWYYLSDHDTNEVIVFKQMDSQENSVPGVPHASFKNPLTPADEPPRQSIEARAMVFYD